MGAISTKDYVRAMEAAGARRKPGKRGHTLWLCPESCGQHTMTVADGHGTLATTVPRTTKSRMPCLALNLPGV